MSLTFGTAKKTFLYAEEHGIEETCKHFNISYETVSRSIRRYKQLLREKKGIEQTKFPKILLFDIETLPMWIRVWGLYKQRPGHKQIVKDWIVLSWAAKWLHESDYISDILTPEEIAVRDDKRICKSMWKLIDEADIIIAHNCNRFDIRKLNSRFMIHGFQPPSAYQTIDTLTYSQKIAAHSSHKLDWLGQLIRNEGKVDTDYELWIKCEEGDIESLLYMASYNREDVGLLEEVYLWMRPWMKSHPNVGLYMDLKRAVCANCGSEELISSSSYYTPAGKYEAVRCVNCGAIGRYRTTALSNNESKLLIRSVAR
jgi:RNase P subunit RPR2